MVRRRRTSAPRGGDRRSGRRGRRIRPGTTDASRFRGSITGLGTTSGTRIVIGDWAESPFGAFADVMVERPDGHRLLLAPTPQIAEFVSATYTFDEVIQVPVAVRQQRRWMHLTAGPLSVQATIGHRTALGWLLRLVPDSLATNTRWLEAVAPVADRLLPGVQVAGSAGSGRQEWYGATDAHAVTAATGFWNAAPLGRLTRVEPPTRFGFSSTPARPARVMLVTTVSTPT